MSDDIIPDDRDWTWVLNRRCPDCGFDASAARGNEVATLMRANAAGWMALGQTGAIKAGRDRRQRWSSLEYAAHVRDVYRLADERLGLLIHEENPLFANWDQDRTAIEDGYDTQDPAVVLAELTAAVDTVAARLDSITANQWERAGRRSDGSGFTINSLARYIVHDPIHHLWDLTGARHQP
ncbi:MAG: DinB family protein [Acidimicrobiales bacterium]